MSEIYKSVPVILFSDHPSFFLSNAFKMVLIEENNAKNYCFDLDLDLEDEKPTKTEQRVSRKFPKVKLLPNN